MSFPHKHIETPVFCQAHGCGAPARSVLRIRDRSNSPIGFYCGSRCAPVAHVVGVNPQARLGTPAQVALAKATGVENGEAPIHKLHDDALSYVLSYLDTASIVALSEATMGMRAMAHSHANAAYWREESATLTPQKTVTDEMLSHFMAEWGKLVQHLDLSNCGLVTNAALCALAAAPMLTHAQGRVRSTRASRV
jgi:hypothetical protein